MVAPDTGPNLLDRLVLALMPITPRFVVRRVSSRYVAGPEVADAVRTVKRLMAEGAVTTLDLLGEEITNLAEADSPRRLYLKLITTIVDEDLASGISLKLTQLGLKLDAARCEENLRSILDLAEQHDIFTRIDMEDSPVTQATLDIYGQVCKDYQRVGVVIQAYLRRSLADVTRIAQAAGDLRICKGIYVEPTEVAFQTHDEIRRSFIALNNLMFDAGAYVGIATHDEAVVAAAIQHIETNTIAKDRYEFQMLLGVRSALRRRLIKQGHRVRVYVPFGRQWYAYSVRRLQENPSLATHVIKGILTGG